MNKIVGILGGMGPMATCDLMKKVIDNTDASCDQEHIRICVDCNTNIPDRTAAIMGKGEDPRPEMIKSAIRLQSMGANVIIVPCNTAHYFLPDVQKCVDIPILNMLKETANELFLKGVSIVAVLATNGTILSGLYDVELKKVGITPVHPDEEDQKLIMLLIYDYVKAGKSYPFTEKILEMEKRLIDKGAQALILGCTELPIAFSQINTSLPTIDPTTVLARVAIRYTNGRLLENNK